MNPADHDIAEKTAAGAEEIRRRAMGLPARLRTLLLLVDGAKSLSELKTLLPALAGLEDAMASLEQQGLIRFRKPALDGDASLQQGAGQAVGASVNTEDHHHAAAPADFTTIPEESRAGDNADLVANAGLGLVRARAHIADALDDVLGIHGYMLRQEVCACPTASALEMLLSEITAALTPLMGEAGAAGVIRRALALLRVGARQGAR